MRGWSELYRASLELGVRYLRRHGYAREAVIRLVIPLDLSRYLELPWALDRLDARAGQAVLDLASPKLLAVTLARRGAPSHCSFRLAPPTACSRGSVEVPVAT